MMKHLLDDPTFASQRRRLLALLSEHSYEQREVVLSSGKPSNFYIDCKQTTLMAEGHFLVGQLFFAMIQHLAPETRAVGGLTMGADPLASATSLVSFIAGRPLHAFYVRKEPKAHGTQQWLEGHKALRDDLPVVILEDVVTTGASTLRAVERARLGGLRVVHVLALVDRGEGGREAVEAEATLTSLFTQGDFR